MALSLPLRVLLVGKVKGKEGTKILKIKAIFCHSLSHRVSPHSLFYAAKANNY
jgi:hypothetical protein